MLATLKILFSPKNNVKLNYNVASLLHGVIMEIVDSSYGEYLHESNLKPFTQYITIANDLNKYIWTINTLNLEAYQKIIKRLNNENLSSLILKHKNIELIIEDKQVSYFNYRDLINKLYIKETPSLIMKIKFLTPTAFKQMGEYYFMPDIRLLYKSIMNKYDNFSNAYTVSSDEILETLVEKTKIIDYTLRSTRFHLEGIKIPSFVGEITIKISGPETMINLINMLIFYSKWCGVGIKTALGMGSVDVYLNKL